MLFGGIIGYFSLPVSTTYEYVRWLVLCVPIILALVVWLFSGSGVKFRSYLSLAKQEAFKVAWPSKKETWQMGLVVFLFVIILTLFVWFSDYLAGWFFYDMILKRKGM